MWQHSWASSPLECEKRNNTILKAHETTLGEYNSGTSLSRKSKKKPHTDAAGKTLKIHIQSFQNSQ
jgi:hypothetical protein